ncbi:hypothetical protein [Mucilaginibacter pedocola]|uniref:DUF4153 domain-containing protein n=1 Tax=Mucilaginibacter pedocola TaxID=1792845 RepID=A0A1S9PNS4_9SPHI|nr:hypothetical protein [Mucilaginibacter pedocola]OOQ62218.1 hypothetical protein BC343_04020 [Mucilaginibacter pedocola]
MMEQILENQNRPAVLEKLYRSNKALFKRDFATLYPQLQGSPSAEFWHERLNYESEEISWGSAREIGLVVIAALFAGLLAKLPTIFNIDQDIFYPRNLGFIVLPLLTAYFGWKSNLSVGKIAFAAIALLAGLVYINAMPFAAKADTLILSCIHLVIFEGCILGFAYAGGAGFNEERRLGFLKYIADLVIMTGLILLAGALTSVITVGLFELIGFNIKDFYFDNIAVMGLAAAPILGTYLTQTNPQLVGKISPVIAKIFTPLVVVMLSAYLVAMIYSRNNPYNNREFLLMFNVLLVGVMALIFFSVAEGNKGKASGLQTWLLFTLSVLTIIVNSIALSAILFRITTGGFTANRTAVLGGNLVILANLLTVAFQLFRAATKRGDIAGVGKVIAAYLPVYFVWAIIVAFLFPLVFGVK